jgi:hypothetical protein
LKVKGLAGIAGAALIVSGAALARTHTERIRFQRGKSTAVIENAVVRGDRDRYLLGARAGQSMSVRITSLERNAVFTVYRPGGQRALAGTEEGKDAVRWSGRLPATGDYEILVGGTRGNASYTLTVSIR